MTAGSVLVTPTNYASPGFTAPDRQSLSLRPAGASPPANAGLTNLLAAPVGGSLPNLCYQIHGGPAAYQKTNFNGLIKFRNIPAGSQLLIPPLTTTS